MKIKIIGIRGYNYTDKKTGDQKQGAILRVVSDQPYDQNDNNGNFEYGCRCDNNIYLPRNYWNMIPVISQNLGHVFRLVKEKQLGDKFDTVTELELLE